MNILIANTQEFNPTIGGVERISHAYALRLQELGHGVWFVACLRSPYSQSYSPAAPQLVLPDRQYNTACNLRALCGYLQENRIEIIHNQAGNIPEFTELCAAAAEKMAIPLVSAVHIDPMHQLCSLRDFRFSRVLPAENIKGIARMVLYPFRVGKIRKYVQRTYRKILGCSAATVVLSPAYIEPLKQIAPQANIIAIPNWLPFENLEKSAEKENTVLYVGRLDHEHKRPDRLLDIWQQVCRGFPDWTLKLAGDGPAGEELRWFVQKNRIPRVQFLGFCDPREEYSKAKILCQTSTIEGLSMVLLEAMAYGCVPVVYDSYAAVYDVIDSGKNGFVVKAFRRRRFVKLLRQLMSDDNLRSAVGESACDIGNRFQKNAIVENWLELYSRCLEENR